MTPGDGFSQVMTGIGLLLERGIRVLVRINYEPDHLMEKRDTLAYLADRFSGSPDFRIYMYGIFPATHETPGADALTGAEAARELLALKRMQRDRGLLYPGQREGKADMGSVLSSLWLRPRVLGCFARSMNGLVIGPEGELYKCEHYLGQGTAYTCGNIYDGVLLNEAFRRMVDRKPVADKCADCNLLPICRGGCRQQALDWGEEQCHPAKYVLPELLTMAVEEMEKQRKQEVHVS